MMEKSELEKLNDAEEMLDFFKKNRKIEITYAQLKLKHAFNNYNQRLTKLYNDMTKGMSKTDKLEFNDELENGLNDEWTEKVGDINSEISIQYKVEIDHENTEVIMTKITDNFIIRYNGEEDENQFDYIKGFSYELNDDAEFLINLITAINKKLEDR